jgi:hypothetical protein
MAPLWARLTWKSYLPKLYAGLRPADFGEYRDQVVASLGRPGYARAFSLTTGTSHAPAEALLAQVAVPVLVRPAFPGHGAEPMNATDPVRRVSVVSTGQVQIRPDHEASNWRPMAWWLLASRSWTWPRPINGYVIEHQDGLVLFDTGQDRASVTDPGYFPRGVAGVLPSK